MQNIRNTKIVCTMGPSSSEEAVMKELVLAGMNVSRLNFSHGNYEEHLGNIEKIRKINRELGTHVAILLDTKGPEIRTHTFEFGGTTLLKDSLVKISMKEVVGNNEIFSVTHPNLINDVKIGGRILVDDGNITLNIEDLDYQNGYIICRVLNDAYIKDRRGINVPDIKLSLDFISPKDREDLIFGCNHGVDYIAASFTRRASDILELREILNTHHGENIKIIAKIENMEGAQNLDQIIEVADGIMVARGDLGVEVPVYEVPILQKEMIHKCHLAGKVVIVATQMLESMQKNPRPTRAEVNDVATAVLAGTDAIMLSGETAAGKYPIEAVKTMSSIAKRMEEVLEYPFFISEVKSVRENDITSTIALSVAEACLHLPIKAIIAPTCSGFTARALSHFRPKAPIIALTLNNHVARSLALNWGVHPVVTPIQEDADELMKDSITIVKNKYLLEVGDEVILTCGFPLKKAKSTNMMKIEIIS